MISNEAPGQALTKSVAANSTVRDEPWKRLGLTRLNTHSDVVWSRERSYGLERLKGGQVEYWERGRLNHTAHNEVRCARRSSFETDYSLRSRTVPPLRWFYIGPEGILR